MSSLKSDFQLVSTESMVSKVAYDDALARIGRFIKRKKRFPGPVIIYGHKEWPMVAGIHSCLENGWTYVPVDSQTPRRRLLDIINAAKPSLLLDCTESLTPEDIPGPEILRSSEVLTASLTDDGNFIGADAGEKEYRDAYIMFTSGSTGKPKGVPVSVKSFKTFLQWIDEEIFPEREEKYRIFNAVSLSFDMSLYEI